MTDDEKLAHTIALIESAAAEVAPALAGVLGLATPNGPIEDRRRRADHARMCIAALLQRAGTDAMVDLAVAIDDLLAFDPVTDPVLAQQIDEWRSLLAATASQRGSAAAPQALRSRGGKGAAVVKRLAAHREPMPRAELAELTAEWFTKRDGTRETTGLSHVLRDLETAGLIARFADSDNRRAVTVELTGLGWAVARAEGLVVEETDIDALMPGWAAIVNEEHFGRTPTPGSALAELAR